MKPFRFIICLALLGCGGGSARTPTSQAIYPVVATNTQGDSCRASAFPKELPALQAIVDSAALSNAFQRSGEQVTQTVFAVRFGQTGNAERVAVVETAGISRAYTRADSIVQAAIRPQTPSGIWGLRLRVQSTAPLIVTVERSQFCPATSAMPQGTEIGIRRVTQTELDDLKRAHEFAFRVLISETGTVTQSVMFRTSGSNVQDRMALEAAQKMRFKPSLLDREPVAAWYEVRSRSR